MSKPVIDKVKNDKAQRKGQNKPVRNAKIRRSSYDQLNYDVGVYGLDPIPEGVLTGVWCVEFHEGVEEPTKIEPSDTVNGANVEWDETVAPAQSGIVDRPGARGRESA